MILGPSTHNMIPGGTKSVEGATPSTMQPTDQSTQPPAAQAPGTEPWVLTPEKDPRVVHRPIKLFSPSAIGSKVCDLLLHPGDVMITHWRRPAFDPLGTDHPMANPGGHCTLYVGFDHFERKQRDIHPIEHCLNKCFDEGDMILRLGSFDVYWAWSPFDAVECFEYQYQNRPSGWFVFSRALNQGLGPPAEVWDRRWQAVGRPQPADAVVPCLRDLVVRRAAAVVWWRPGLELRTGDLLVRVGVKGAAGPGPWLFSVEMWECAVKVWDEFTGRCWVARRRVEWRFLGRDMQVYGEEMVGRSSPRVERSLEARSFR